MDDLIEKLRAVKWEATDDCDRMPDGPTHKCVLVDMRPDDFRALLREAADALEAARAEAAEWKRVAAAQAELHDEAEDHAEDLAKALAGLITWIPSADTYRRLGFDPEAPMRALKRAKLSLGSIGGLSND